MLDRDLAKLYQVETRILNQAVKRNQLRFPEAFCFQMNDEEFMNWKSQIVISNSEKMALRKNPFVFTEQGVAMLSAVLRSEAAGDACVFVFIYLHGCKLKIGFQNIHLFFIPERVFLPIIRKSQFINRDMRVIPDQRNNF